MEVIAHPGPRRAVVTPGVVLSGVSCADYEMILRSIAECRIVNAAAASISSRTASRSLIRPPRNS